MGVAAVACGHRHISGGGGGLVVVVVDDGADALVVGNKPVGGAGEVDLERFVQLELDVAVDQDRDRLVRLSRSKGQRSAGALVIVVGEGGGPIGGRIIDRDGL